MIEDEITFLKSPLVTWVQCCFRSPEFRSLWDSVDRLIAIDDIDYRSLCEGNLLNAFLLYIDHRPNRHQIYLYAGDAHVRLRNLAVVLANIQDFYMNVLDQSVIMSMPDIGKLAKRPFSEESGDEMKKLLLLLLGAAIQSPNKEAFIDRIKCLDISIQEALAHEISLVTSQTDGVLNISTLIKSAQDLDQLKAMTDLKHVLLQRDEYLQILADESSHDVENLSENGESSATESSHKTSHPKLPEAEQYDSHTPTSSFIQVASLRHENKQLKHQIHLYQHESEERLEYTINLRDTIDEKETNILSLKKDISDMKRDMRMAKFYRDEVDALQESIAKCEKLDKDNSSLRERLKQLDVLKSQNDALRNELIANETVKTELENQLKKERTAVRRAHSLQYELEAALFRVQTLQQELESDKILINQLINDNSVLGKQCASAQKRVSTLEEDIKELEMLKRESATVLADELSDSMQIKLGELEEENERLTVNMRDNERVFKQLQFDIQLSMNLEKAKDNEIDDLKSTRRSLDEEIQQVQSERESTRSQIIMLTQQLDRTKKQFMESCVRVNELNEESEKMHLRINELHERIRSLQERLVEIEAQKESLELQLSKSQCQLVENRAVIEELSGMDRENRDKIATQQTAVDYANKCVERLHLELENTKFTHADIASAKLRYEIESQRQREKAKQLEFEVCDISEKLEKREVGLSLLRRRSSEQQNELDDFLKQQEIQDALVRNLTQQNEALQHDCKHQRSRIDGQVTENLKLTTLMVELRTGSTSAKGVIEELKMENENLLSHVECVKSELQNLKVEKANIELHIEVNQDLLQERSRLLEVIDARLENSIARIEAFESRSRKIATDLEYVMDDEDVSNELTSPISDYIVSCLSEIEEFLKTLNISRFTCATQTDESQRKDPVNDLDDSRLSHIAFNATAVEFIEFAPTSDDVIPRTSSPVPTEDSRVTQLEANLFLNQVKLAEMDERIKILLDKLSDYEDVDSESHNDYASGINTLTPRARKLAKLMLRHSEPSYDDFMEVEHGDEVDMVKEHCKQLEFENDELQSQLKELHERIDEGRKPSPSVDSFVSEETNHTNRTVPNRPTSLQVGIMGQKYRSFSTLNNSHKKKGLLGHVKAVLSRDHEFFELIQNRLKTDYPSTNEAGDKGLGKWNDSDMRI